MRSKKAFTVVEILIAIAVIAILATLVIIGYNGIQQQARVSAIQSDLRLVGNRLTLYHSQNNGTYPANISQLNLQNTPATTLNYQQLASGSSYCITSTSGSTTYYAIAGMQAREGGCVLALGLTNGWLLDGETIDNVGGSHATGANLSSASNQKNVAGTAYDFNGTNANIVIGTAPQFSLAEGSISAWIRPDSYAGSNRFIFASGESDLDGISTLGGGIMMYIDGSTGYLKAGWSDGAGDFDFAQSNTALAMGQWYHVVLTYITTGSNVKLYINNVLQTTQDVFTNNVITGWETTARIGSTYSGGYFDGIIDNVLVYDQSLSVSEVNTVYQAGP